jgi:hypothetical protein
MASTSPARLVLLAVTAVVVMACAPSSGSSPVVGRISGVVVAGPTCPVVTDPPQSGCDDRPVSGARLVLVNDAGVEVAAVTSGTDGRFEVVLPPGRYELRPGPVDGLMGTAPPMEVTVQIGQPAEVTLGYDTGIR